MLKKWQKEFLDLQLEQFVHHYDKSKNHKAKDESNPQE